MQQKDPLTLLWIRLLSTNWGPTLAAWPEWETMCDACRPCRGPQHILEGTKPGGSPSASKLSSQLSHPSHPLQWTWVSVDRGRGGNLRALRVGWLHIGTRIHGKRGFPQENSESVLLKQVHSYGRNSWQGLCSQTGSNIDFYNPRQISSPLLAEKLWITKTAHDLPESIDVWVQWDSEKVWNIIRNCIR